MYFEMRFDVIMSPCALRIVLSQVALLPQIVMCLNMLKINQLVLDSLAV